MPKRKTEHALIPLEVIEQRIFILRGHRVMLDRDLAALYQVETRTLNQAVKRNIDRFPADFMFRLTTREAKDLLLSRSQSVMLKRGANVKHVPYAFTEHGAVMLANILKSARAVRVSIQIVRAFVHLRQLIATNDSLARQIEALQNKVGKHDEDLEAILATLHEILQPPAPPQRPLGFIAPGRKRG